MSKSIVLFSGGLDSTVSLAATLERGRDCIALFFSYGQRHIQELEAARDITDFYRVPLELIELPLITGQCSSSLLSSSNTRPPMDRTPDEIGNSETPPPTYVPGRNVIFLSHALSLAEIKGCNEVIFSPNALDLHYPDCVPIFIDAMQKVYDTGVSYPILLKTPLIKWNKSQIIQEGMKLRAPLSYTLSCYNPHPQRVHCGHCDACVLRKEGFKQANIEDPTKYNHLMQTHS